MRLLGTRKIKILIEYNWIYLYPTERERSIKQEAEKENWKAMMWESTKLHR